MTAKRTISRPAGRARQATSVAAGPRPVGRSAMQARVSAGRDVLRRPKTVAVPGQGEGPALYLSHSSLTAWELCPQLYKLRFVDNLACSAGGCTGTAAEWGTAVHRGLAAWHRHGDITVACAATASHPFAPSGHLSSATAVRILEEYIGHYGPADECMHPRWVEREFTVPVGTIGTTAVRFAGTLDMALAKDGQAVVVDHKTTGLSLDLWSHAQRVSAQWPGYVLGAQALTGLPCRRVVVNAISNRKEAKPRFTRFDVIVDEETLAEWRQAVLTHAGDILRAHASGLWPLHRSSCARQWERPCEFFSVCELPCASRERHVARSADIGPRRPGPTEKRIPLGLR